MFGNMLMGAAGASLAAGGYSVSNSIVLDDGSSQNLKRTPSLPASERIGTFSMWVKRGVLGTSQRLFSNERDDGAATQGLLEFQTNDQLRWKTESTAGANIMVRETTQVFRDPHAWYHIMVTWNSNKTDDTCASVWVNGEQVTDFVTKTNFSSPQDIGWPSTTKPMVIGSLYNNSTYFDGYLSEVVYLDGTASSNATDFGEYDLNGVWRPIELDTATLFPNPTITDNSVNFDGTNDYLTRGGALTGLTDGDAGSTSFWFKLNGGDGSDVSIFTDNAGHVHIRRGSDNKIRMLMHTSGAAELVDIQTSDTYIADGVWHHCMASWNTTSNTQHLYIDGVDKLSVNNSATGTIDYTQTEYAVGARTSGTNKINSDLAEFYFTNEYLDLSQSSNRLKFLTATGAPASLGSDGSTPTGTAAVVYLSGATSTWHTNDGTGGGFTENGALTDGSAIQGVYGRNSFYLPFSAGSGANLGANSVPARTFTPAAANYTYNATYLTIGSGTINNNGSPGVSGRLNNPFNGDFTFSFTATAIAGSIFGVFDATELSTFSTGTDDGGLDSMTNSWWYDDGGNGTGGGGTVGNGYFMYGNSSQGTGPIAAGSAVTIERTGSTIKITDDSSDAHSFSQTFSGPVYIMVGHRNIASKSMDYDSVSMNGKQAFAVNNSPTQSSDTPTNNSATLTTIDGSGATFSNGNLVVGSNTTNSYKGGTGCIGLAPGSGSWYVEALCTGATGSNKEYVFGAATNDTNKAVAGYFPGSATYSNDDEHGYYSGSGGIVYNGSSSTGSVGIYGDGNTVALRFDMDVTTPTCKFYVNDTLKHTANLTVGKTYYPHFNTQDLNLTFTVNFGATPFTYTLPTGHLAINTTNLYTNAAPAIEDGTAYFQATAYTGNGSPGHEINQSGNSTFKPSFTWFKNRDVADSHALYDLVRGITKRVYSNSSLAETTTSDVASFDADGFTVNADTQVNGSGDGMIAWQWKGDGTSGASNTNGTITTTVNVDQTSGFSIVNWLGDNVDLQTIGHGLGATPSMMIYRKREGSQWFVQHAGLTGGIDNGTSTKQLIIDGTDPEGGPFSGGYIDTVGSSTVRLKKGSSSMNNCNASGDNYMAYMFAEIPGYSAFGSYEGNGSSSNGPLIQLGFKPAYIMFKNVDATGSWAIFDTTRDSSGNPVDDLLQANLADAEVTDSTDDVDFLANGAKVRSTWVAINGSGNTIIYMAFAEHPFAGTTPTTAR